MIYTPYNQIPKQFLPKRFRKIIQFVLWLRIFYVFELQDESHSQYGFVMNLKNPLSYLFLLLFPFIWVVVAFINEKNELRQEWLTMWRNEFFYLGEIDNRNIMTPDSTPDLEFMSAINPNIPENWEEKYLEMLSERNELLEILEDYGITETEDED